MKIVTANLILLLLKPTKWIAKSMVPGKYNLTYYLHMHVIYCL